MRLAKSATRSGSLVLALPLAVGYVSLASPGPAFAQAAAPEIQSKIVPSGEKRQLAFFTSLNADCSVNADMTVRIGKQPAHGAVGIDRGPGYTNYERRDMRYFCNLVPVEGYQILYMPDEGFKGDDEFVIEFFSPSGRYTVSRYEVVVK